MSDPVEPNSKGKAPPEAIRAYWESTTTPSQKSIEAKMRADGWKVSASSIARAVANKFAAITSPEIQATARSERNAANAADVASPLVMAEAMVEALAKTPDGERDRIKALIDMNDDDLLKNTSKLIAVGRYRLAEELAANAKMMMLAPDKAAKLMMALGSSLQPIIQPPKPPDKPPEVGSGNGDGARVINAEVMTPSGKAISDFLNRKDRSAA